MPSLITPVPARGRAICETLRAQLVWSSYCLENRFALPKASSVCTDFFSCWSSFRRVKKVKVCCESSCQSCDCNHQASGHPCERGRCFLRVRHFHLRSRLSTKSLRNKMVRL